MLRLTFTLPPKLLVFFCFAHLEAAIYIFLLTNWNANKPIYILRTNKPYVANDADNTGNYMQRNSKLTFGP